MTTPLIALSCSVAALASAIAAWTDHRTGRIPNWLTLSTAVLGLLIHGAMGGVRSLLVSALGLMIGAAVPAILYKVSAGRGIGGGDVKLFAALGALLGPSLSIEVQFGSFVLLAVFALIRLTFRGALWRVLLNSACLLVNPFIPPKCRRKVEPETLTEMRMGPAIACSVISTLVLEHLSRVLPWFS